MIYDHLQPTTKITRNPPRALGLGQPKQVGLGAVSAGANVSLSWLAIAALAGAVWYFSKPRRRRR